MKKKIIAYIVGILIFLIVFLVLFIVVNFVGAYTDLYPFGIQNNYLTFYCLLVLLIPILAGFIVARQFFKWCERRKNIKVNWFPQNRSIRIIIFSLYLFTAVAGIPSIQSHNTKWAIDEYKRINTGDNPRVWDTHPYIRSYFALPILPFIVLSYHEYQLDGLYGLGSWDVQLWYIFGVKRIIQLPLWIS